MFFFLKSNLLHYSFFCCVTTRAKGVLQALGSGTSYKFAGALLTTRKQLVCPQPGVIKKAKANIHCFLG